MEILQENGRGGFMYIISPKNHTEANKVWKEKLGGRPNGARVLGEAQAKYLSKEFAKYYDLLVTYSVNLPFEIPEGTKRIAVMWHQNYPWTEGFKQWQRVNIKLKDYQVDYFANEHKIVDLINEVKNNAFFLPRFVDTDTLPKPMEKTIDTLWYGNRWNSFSEEFDIYKRKAYKPLWVSQGKFGDGDKIIKDNLTHEESLDILRRARVVWAIGVSQLEAQAFGAKVVPYRGQVLPLYTEKTAPVYLRRLLDKIWAERNPRLGK